MRAYIEGSQTDLATPKAAMVRIPKVDRDKASKHFITANNTPFVTRPVLKEQVQQVYIEGIRTQTKMYSITPLHVFQTLILTSDLQYGTVTVLNNVTETSLYQIMTSRLCRWAGMHMLYR